MTPVHTSSNVTLFCTCMSGCFMIINPHVDQNIIGGDSPKAFSIL